ncbi:hypothetical protein ACET3Z_002072 [Daucus carota]
MATVTKDSKGQYPAVNNNGITRNGQKLSEKGSTGQGDHRSIEQGRTHRENIGKAGGFRAKTLEEASTKQKQLESIYEHWFLLDDELVTAIRKGNTKLVPVALARIEYLLGNVPKNLVEESLKGEEEGLCRLGEFLYNNGWWERAQNLKIYKEANTSADLGVVSLLQFIRANEHLIHPNVRRMVAEGNNEGIRMALNHIHYRSLEEGRKNKKITENQGSRLYAKNLKQKLVLQQQMAKDFISGFEHLIEPSVFRDAMANNEKALSLALGQIHHKTLPLPNSEKGGKSYKEVLLSKPSPQDQKKHGKEPRSANNVQANKGQEVAVKEPGIDVESETNIHNLEAEARATTTLDFTGGKDAMPLSPVKLDIEASDTSHREFSEGTISEGEDGSCINPTTPRTLYDETQEILEESKGEVEDFQERPLCEETMVFLEDPKGEIENLQETDIHTANWRPRERDSSSSFPNSASFIDKSSVDNLSGEDSDSLTFTSGVLKEIRNLKVQVKRGRPRKYNQKQVNKHFKVPRRKKGKGEGLQQITHTFLNANYDEAEAIYETGLMMGLLPTDEREQSIKLIKENLL